MRAGVSTSYTFFPDAVLGASVGHWMNILPGGSFGLTNAGMAKQPHWILVAIFATILGAIPWAVFGFLLNVLIPVLGVVICCQSLGASYYWFAYWFPLASWVLISGFVLWLLGWTPTRKAD